MGTSSVVRKRVRLAEEYQHFEDDLLVDKNYDKLLRLVQVGDENLESVKLEPLDFDFDGISECAKTPNKRNLKASYTPKPSKRVEVMEDVKLEDPDSDSGRNHGVSERCSKRPHLETSNTPKPSKRVEVMEDVKLEDPDSDSGRNHGVSERCSKRPHLETSNTPKKEKINRTSSMDWKKAKMVQQSVRHRRSRNALSIHIDETFEAFLNHSKVSGDQMIYAPRNGTRNIYEKEMQISSDSEQTVLDNKQRDGCRCSCVKTKATTSRSFSKDVMKRKMSCPKNYEDTYSHSYLNEQDCRQDNRYPASFNSQVKRKTPTEDLEDLRAQKSSAAKKKKKKTTEEALNTVCAELDLANESYEAFISFTEVDDKNFMYTPSNGGRRIYEEGETTSDAETNAMQRDPLDNIHTMDTDGGHSIQSHNQFREGLLEDLGRPYNLHEHLTLLEDALKQGPSDHEIDLFNEMEPCQTPRVYGNSYLVVYTDLSENINAAKGDRSRIINLLRGLFYWLKNKSLEGSFIPWKDKTCLKVLPQPE